MRRVILIALIVLFIAPVVYAEPGPTLNPFELIRRAVVYGIDDTLRFQGDKLNNISGTNASHSNILPYTLIEPSSELLSNPIINRFADMQAFLFEWIFFRFLEVGLIIILISYVREDYGERVQRIRFINENVLDLGKFLELVFIGILLWKVGDLFIEGAFRLEDLFSGFLAQQIIYISPPLPLSGIEHLLSAGSRLFVFGYGIFRYLVIGIILSVRDVIFVLCFFPKIGDITYGIVVYGTLLLYSRIALVGSALIGSAIAQVTFITSILFSYAVIHWILILVSILIMFGPIFMSRIFRKSAQMVVKIA